jgi:hypothetical protein
MTLIAPALKFPEKLRFWISLESRFWVAQSLQRCDQSFAMRTRFKRLRWRFFSKLLTVSGE